MNEWLKKMVEKVKDFWKNSKTISKVILIGVVAVVIVAVVLAITLPSKKVAVKLFNAPVTNEVTRQQILDRLDELNVAADVDSNNYITIQDEKSKTKIVSILASEGLTPSSWDPFQDFYNRKWSSTDMEQNQKLKNAIIKRVQQQLEALDDINAANVTIVVPEKEIFSKDQNPVTASIVLRLSPKSELPTNKTLQKNLQRLVLTMIEGLKQENLTISDTDNNVLNDFEGMEDADRLTNIQKEQKIRHAEEAKLKANILNQFQHIVTPDRLGDLVVYLEMDMSKESSDSTIYTPIQRRTDNPRTPYDDSEFVEGDTLPISEQVGIERYQGTAFNPEGPAGIEGQNPPVYSDMSNTIGSSEKKVTTKNNVINTTHKTRTESPQVGRRSVSINIDGKWEILKDPKTHKYKIDPETGNLCWKYYPLTTEELSGFLKLLKASISFNEERGDNATVTNNQVDRSKEHQEFQDAYFKKLQTQKTVFLALIAVAVVLVGFILFRIISKELERRRRLREEELLRKQQAERERALWEASNDSGVAVTMSVEESRRAELQENAINMAKEHPEDVALLIRTWLMEE